MRGIMEIPEGSDDVAPSHYWGDAHVQQVHAVADPADPQQRRDGQHLDPLPEEGGAPRGPRREGPGGGGRSGGGSGDRNRRERRPRN